jgi:hypothetical protein
MKAYKEARLVASTQEVEIGGLWSELGPGKSEDLSTTQTKKQKDWGQLEALSSTPSVTKKTERKEVRLTQ